MDIIIKYYSHTFYRKKKYMPFKTIPGSLLTLLVSFLCICVCVCVLGSIKTTYKDCYPLTNCPTGSINLGMSKSSSFCCSSDLCNVQDSAGILLIIIVQTNNLHSFGMFNLNNINPKELSDLF